MWTKLGIVSLLAGGATGVFTGISSFMQSADFWENLTVSQILPGPSDMLVDLIPIESVQDGIGYCLYDLHLGWFFVGISMFFFLVGFFFKEN